ALKARFALLPNELLVDATVLVLEVATAQLGSEARLEDVEVGRFREVIVRARVDALDHGGGIVAGREHDQGDVAPLGGLLDGAARVLAREAGHDQVEEDAVDPLSRQELERFVSGARQEDVIALLPQLLSEALEENRAVVDGQKPLRDEGARRG